MFFIYKFLINIVFFFSPLILIIRLIKEKEDPKRFKEKIDFFFKKRKKGNLDMVSWRKCRRNPECHAINRKIRKK